MGRRAARFLSMINKESLPSRSEAGSDHGARPAHSRALAPACPPRRALCPRAGHADCFKQLSSDFIPKTQAVQPATLSCRGSTEVHGEPPSRSLRPRGSQRRVSERAERGGTGKATFIHKHAVLPFKQPLVL